MPDTILRGPYAQAQADYTMPQPVYSAAEHATWRALATRQAALLPDHAAQAYRDGLAALGGDGGVPDFTAASTRLAGGWRLVGVPGLIPERDFFTHLAERRFPVTTWIRRWDELDYIVEPDIFHDFQGHVPLLTQPDFAEFLAAYGAAGRDAAAEHLPALARLYWHAVEFGLIRKTEGLRDRETEGLRDRESAGLRAYGAGILSSAAETLHATQGPATRLRFDLARVLRSDYEIDHLQPLYFVIESYAALFDALAELHAALAALGPPIPAGATTPADIPA